jgi:hypothetical protein
MNCDKNLIFFDQLIIKKFRNLHRFAYGKKMDKIHQNISEIKT